MDANLQGNSGEVRAMSIGGELFVCVRCLHLLRPGEPVDHFEPDWFDYGGSASRCTSHGACDERVKERRAQHREEIERRVRHLKEGECLLVIQDQFGAKYDSYGNYYVTVAEEDAQDEWDKRQEEVKENGEEGCLVLSETRRQ